VLPIYNILDFETTGFSADFDRVIEVGVVKIQAGKIVDTFQEFINPGVRIPSAITSLTGITNSMVRDSEDNTKVMPRLKTFVKEELIIAHNASFDARFYRAELTRLGISCENEFLCSLLLARRIYQNLDSHKLGNLCQYLGFINKSSHRALGDAEATAQVFDAIYNEISIKSNTTNLNFQYLKKLSKVPKNKVGDWLQVN
jgi:DNA polymerase-3 subunit epsilon